MKRIENPGMLKIASASGHALEAPLAVWFTALFRTLTKEQQGQCFIHANEIHKELITAMIAGTLGKTSLPINLTTEGPPIQAVPDKGKPNEVTEDEDGKLHHRMFCELGTYDEIGALVSAAVNRKEAKS